MNYITTTELRTKSSQLIDSLKRGQSVFLIHRSNVIAKIFPKNDDRDIKTIDAKKLQKTIDQLNFPKLSLKEIDKRYRASMMKKHGKSIS